MSVYKLTLFLNRIFVFRPTLKTVIFLPFQAGNIRVKILRLERVIGQLLFSNVILDAAWVKKPDNTCPGGLLVSIFAGYVPLASQSPYPIIVYSVANYRPHLSHFWANMSFSRSQLSHFIFMYVPYIE